MSLLAAQRSTTVIPLGRYLPDRSKLCYCYFKYCEVPGSPENL